MNLSETIESIFHEGNIIANMDKLNEIGDLLEFEDWTKEEIITSINCLLRHIKSLQDEMIIENILNIISNVMNAQNVFSGFELEPVISCLDKLNTECISYILTFLGFSGNEEYKDIIQLFLANDSLKEEAEEALFELDFRLGKMEH